jgi:hypothetical protein
VLLLRAIGKAPVVGVKAVFLFSGSADFPIGIGFNKAAEWKGKDAPVLCA